MQDNKKEIMNIPVEDIIPNRFQPRLTFDDEALRELADSIREHGIIQPLVVRKVQDKYEIIAGERRFKAASLINMQKVPCIVMDLNDNESAEVAVIENIQRKEMSPLEEAKSFKKILDKGYLTQEELAKRMGKSQSSVANKLRLLNLDDVVQEAILNNKISERHARSLLKIENKADQRQTLNEIIEKRLTVRQTDELIKEKFGSDKVNNDVENYYNKEEKTNDVQNNIFKDPVQKVENPYAGYKSTPEVNIPMRDLRVNPQANIINNMTSEPSSIIDMYKYNDTNNTNNNINVNNNNNDIQSVINPSVFSQTGENMNNNNNINNNNFISQNNNINDNFNNNINNNNFENRFINSNNNSNNNINNNINDNIINDVSTNNINTNNTYKNENITSVETLNTDIPNTDISNNNGLMVDINSIKSNAQDILKKEDNSLKISDLMASEGPENKFFVDLNMPLDNTVLPFKVQSALDSINRRLDEIKMQGTNLRKEEKDLGTAYQVIITIDK